MFCQQDKSYVRHRGFFKVNSFSRQYTVYTLNSRCLNHIHHVLFLVCFKNPKKTWIENAFLCQIFSSCENILRVAFYAFDTFLEKNPIIYLKFCFMLIRTHLAVLPARSGKTQTSKYFWVDDTQKFMSKETCNILFHTLVILVIKFKNSWNTDELNRFMCNVRPCFVIQIKQISISIV